MAEGGATAAAVADDTAVWRKKEIQMAFIDYLAENMIPLDDRVPDQNSHIVFLPSSSRG